MLQRLRLFALGLSVLAVYPQAHAEVISITNLNTTSANVGPTTWLTPFNYISNYEDRFITDYSSTTEIKTEVVDLPTVTTAGLAKDYEVTKVKYKNNITTYKIEHLQVGLDAPGSTPAGSKQLTLSGSVTSTIATTIYFDLSSYGTYVPGNSPFGATVPALASLYLGETLGTLAPTAVYAYADTGSSSYSVSNVWSYALNIAAGAVVDFYAAAFAPNDASLNNLSVSVHTAYYGHQTVTTPYENETKVLVNARVLPPLAVPETSTYAMLLAGLGVIGFIRRRRGKAWPL